MNIETLNVPKAEARERWIEYRSSVRRARDKRRIAADMELDAAHTRRTAIEREEDDLRAAYRALALGKSVICLPQVIRNAGFTTDGYPLLACTPSDWQWCHFRLDGEQHVVFKKEDYWGRNVAKLRVAVRAPKRDVRARALVPPVPPRFRPEVLSDYFTLFEAVWEPAPPVDPILLKRIGRTMFVVVAQWDLTAVERAVLEGRFGG